LTFFFIRKIRTVFTHQDDDTAQRASEPLQLRLLPLFAVIGFLYVGTETSISGWMMTYVGRLPISSRMWAPIATSCFWIALLCGRTLVPLVGRRLSEAQLLTKSLIAAFLCTALLLLSRVPLAIVISASLAGLMLAPIFPLALAKVLRLTHGSPATKVVFATSGLGGAALPWITGEFSAHTGSLRIGLLVPVFALGTMIILNRISRGPAFAGSILGLDRH
jgi:MFS transporter, FHS family, glucose/mannose:H+ symporter